MPRAVLALLASFVGVVAVPATAAACDPSTAGPVVLRGESPGGVRWEQRVDGSRRHGLRMWLNFAAPYEDFGGGMGTDRLAQVLMADWSGGLGPDGDELLIAGIAPRRTLHVTIAFDDGRVLTTVARHARPAALRREPRLDRWRYFAVATHGDRADVTAIEALDESGTVIARDPLAAPAVARGLHAVAMSAV